MSGYSLYGNFTLKKPLSLLSDYIVVGIQQNLEVDSSLAFLYRQQPADKVSFAYTYRNMPLVKEKEVSNLDSMSVLASVLSGESVANTCPEFNDPTNDCNGLGNVFGYKYKDATAKADGNL